MTASPAGWAQPRRRPRASRDRLLRGANDATTTSDGPAAGRGGREGMRERSGPAGPATGSYGLEIGEGGREVSNWEKIRLYRWVFVNIYHRGTTWHAMSALITHMARLDGPLNTV
jgi:hypothetical protein